MPQLVWLGDAQAKHSARRVPYRLLEPVAQVGEANALNWLIQGDNLDALKALLPFHARVGSNASSSTRRTTPRAPSSTTTTTSNTASGFR